MVRLGGFLVGLVGLVGLWIVGVINFPKMYGLYGLKHHIVEISGDVTDADGRTTNNKER